MQQASCILTETNQAPLALLKLTSETTGVFLILKRAAECALYNVEKIKKFKSNREEWSEFGQHIQDSVACIIQTIPNVAIEPQTDMRKKVENLHSVLDAIKHDIDDMQTQKITRRLWNFCKDPEQILEMTERLDEALDLFNVPMTPATRHPDQPAQLGPGQMPTTVTSFTTVGAGQVNNVNGDQYIVYEASNIPQNAALLRLSYVDGASWSPTLVCLAGTRVELLEEVDTWVAAIFGHTNIYWLKGVAGSGKTAFAHTVAQRFHTIKLLVSSFFFDRNISHRNTPRQLFSIIARDLASRSPALAADIAAVLEEQPSLATASLSLQFEYLILGPLTRHPLGRPAVIVIDAMDEASEDECYIEFLTILRDGVHKHPQTIRIIVTSRPTSMLNQYLEGREHVTSRGIDIHSAENLQDIELYMHSRLLEIATSSEMSEGWPDHMLCNEFQRAAEGLFIWVSTICNYLRTTHDPDGQLRSFVSQHGCRGLPPTEKMDKLYTDILNTCNWHDKAFVGDYGLVMGAIMAAKRPLSIATWQSFHGDSLKRPVKRLVDSLGSLLTGTTDVSQPVRILHQSFRDFITHRAREHADTMHFYVSETEHNQRLAFLCLIVINRELLNTIPGVGYLSKSRDKIPGIPKVSGVPEHLVYSCESWTAHLADVASLVSDAMLDNVSKVVSTRLTLWMEMITALGHFQGSVRVRDWLETTAPDISYLYDTKDQSSVLFWMSSRLSYEGRREEALSAIQEAVELYRTLAADGPATSNPSLIKSLIVLSHCLSDLGHREEALARIEEAVELYQTLAAERPATFNLDLASSLNNLSICLSDLGRREEAMARIEEAIGLYRTLAAERPATFNLDLARSLNNLSNRLSDLGRREEALARIKEAVELHRTLAAERPATFNLDLARSLNNLSLRLSDLGRREEALARIEEAVELRRTLAAERPAAFNPDLARSLNNLSNRLSDLGRREEALARIEEAVELHRTLAAERPATFNPDLARSLYNLSLPLSDLGRQEEAVVVIQEAIDLCRALAAERPMFFNPKLANALHRLSSYLSRLNRRDEARLAKEEAIALTSSLAAPSRA